MSEDQLATDGNPIDVTQAPGESLTAGESTTSLAVTSSPDVVAAPVLPMGIASDKLTDIHKETFWEMAKTDVDSAWAWLKSELGKI